jgi:GNAT superfamily N-acetyltransferase
MSVEIRPATAADALEIARVHVSSWHTSYTNILPDDVLEYFTVYRRVKAWQHILESDNQQRVVVAVDDGQVVGFASGGPARDDDLKEDGYDSELYAIYLFQDVQGQGLGRRLMESVAAALQQDGYDALYLWVMQDNSGSHGFYTHMGGQQLKEKNVTRGSKDIVNVAYGWPNITDLTPGQST